MYFPTILMKQKTAISSSKHLMLLKNVSDNPELKQGLQGACSFLNVKVSQFLKDKDLPLSKTALAGLSSWLQRQRDRMHNSSPKQDNAFQED
jgi:hypothetical protein